MSNIRIPPLTSTSPADLQRWARQVSEAVEKTLNGRVADVNFAPLRSYTVDELPDPTGTKRLIFVSNESGGTVVAFNDGQNWRRTTDRAVVS